MSFLLILLRHRFDIDTEFHNFRPDIRCISIPPVANSQRGEDRVSLRNLFRIDVIRGRGGASGLL